MLLTNGSVIMDPEILLNQIHTSLEKKIEGFTNITIFNPHLQEDIHLIRPNLP